MIVTFRIKIPKETEIEVLFLFDRLYDFFFFTTIRCILKLQCRNDAAFLSF